MKIIEETLLQLEIDKNSQIIDLKNKIENQKKNVNDKTQALENRIEALKCKCRKLTEIGDKTTSDSFKLLEEKMFLENKNVNMMRKIQKSKMI